MRRSHDKLLIPLHFIPVLKLWFLISLSFIATSTNGALLPCPLSLLFFIHLLPFPFPSFTSCLTALLTLLPDDSRFALVTAPPTLSLPTIFPPEMLHRCSPVCPSVPLSGRSSTQRRLSGWPGAGPGCWTFYVELCAERPCCCSLCLVSHEWHTVGSDWDFANTNVYSHFHQW